MYMCVYIHIYTHTNGNELPRDMPFWGMRIYVCANMNICRHVLVSMCVCV